MPSRNCAGTGRACPGRSCSVSGSRKWRPLLSPQRSGSRGSTPMPASRKGSRPAWTRRGRFRSHRRGAEVPFKDPHDRRRYDRERKRLLRAQEGTRPTLAVPVRLKVAEDVEALLDEAVRTIRADRKAKGVERARALTQV